MIIYFNIYFCPKLFFNVYVCVCTDCTSVYKEAPKGQKMI